MKNAKEKRLDSQITQKAMKNSARLPRTAGLRTLSELTDSLTKAGLDPSRIQERAEMIAKTRSAQRKRKREEEDADMDVDEDADESMGGEEEEGWMDVDGEDATPKKRRKSNTGAVTAVAAKGKREPRANRQLAGMRDDEVGLRPCLFALVLLCLLTG
jgi:nucleolar GTP-binding protein